MRDDWPTLAFAAFCIAWGLALAILVGSLGCGGSQRRCADAVAIGKVGEPRCPEVQR